MRFSGFPPEKFTPSAAHFVDSRQSLKGLLGSKHLLNRILRMQLPLQLFSLLPLRNKLIFLFEIGSMEHFESVDILRQGCPLVDDPLQLVVLSFEGVCSSLVPFDELLSLKLNLFRKLGNFLVLQDDSFVEIGP